MGLEGILGEAWGQAKEILGKAKQELKKPHFYSEPEFYKPFGAACISAPVLYSIFNSYTPLVACAAMTGMAGMLFLSFYAVLTGAKYCYEKLIE